MQHLALTTRDILPYRLDNNMCGGLGKGVIWDCAFFLRNSRLKFKYYCYMKVDTIFAKCTRTVHAADSAVSVCRVDALQVRSKVTVAMCSMRMRGIHQMCFN